MSVLIRSWCIWVNNPRCTCIMSPSGDERCRGGVNEKQSEDVAVRNDTK
jgi:hypothetical protein